MKCRLLWPLLALAACSQSPQQQGPAPSPSASAGKSAGKAATSATPPIDAQWLHQYRWRLTEATDRAGKHIDALFIRNDKPLTLDFTADRLSVINSCNGIGGSYSLNGDRLQVGTLAHTLMACPDPALAALDDAISQRLQGAAKLSTRATGPSPSLVLVAANGDTLTFTGDLTAEARYGGPAETIFLEVAAQTVPCNHPLIPDKQCLSVRERHYDEHGLQAGAPGEWQPLNQDIEGYTHDPGMRNVLRVKRYTIKNPPAGAPSQAYVLDLVVESEKVQ